MGTNAGQHARGRGSECPPRLAKSIPSQGGEILLQLKTNPKREESAAAHGYVLVL